MKKKYMLPLLSSFLLVACGGGSNVDVTDPEEVAQLEDNMDEEVNMTIFGVTAPEATRSWEEMPLMQELADNVNLNITWDNVTPQQQEEQLNLIFASNDLPDAFYSAWTMGTQTLTEAAQNGQLIPLNNLIEAHAPNIQKVFDQRPEILASITAPDGNIYAVPQINESPGLEVPSAMFINQNWLDQVNMEIPTTLEEFKEVLIAFRDSDLENADDKLIPMTYRPNDWIRDASPLVGAFGLGTSNIGVEDSKVYYGAVQDEYKEYLEFMHDLYSEQLIDQEVFTHNVNVYSDKIASDPPTAGVFFSNTLQNDLGSTADMYVPLPPMEGPRGDKGWVKTSTTFSVSGFSITSENENPVRAIKWLDQQFDPIMSLQMSQGPIGETLEENEDGTISRVTPPEGQNAVEFLHYHTPGSYAVYAVLEDMYDKVELSSEQQEKADYADIYGEYGADELYPLVMRTPEDASRLDILGEDIGSFVKQKMAEFITEGFTDADWEAYVDQINTLGLEEYLELNQKYYDEFLENK